MSWAAVLAVLRRVPAWAWGWIVVALLVVMLWSSSTTARRQAVELDVLRRGRAADLHALEALEQARVDEARRRQLADEQLAKARRLEDERRQAAEAELELARQAIESYGERINRAAAAGDKALALEVDAAFGGAP